MSILQIWIGANSLYFQMMMMMMIACRQHSLLTTMMMMLHLFQSLHQIVVRSTQLPTALPLLY